MSAQNMSAQNTAVLLMAHGSRRPEANEDLHLIANELKNCSEYKIVEPSFLEIAEPAINAGGRRCVEQGAQLVLMLPFFLSAGSHVGQDLARIRNELSDEFPDVDFQLCPPLGRHKLIIEIIKDRLNERFEPQEFHIV